MTDTIYPPIYGVEEEVRLQQVGDVLTGVDVDDLDTALAICQDELEHASDTGDPPIFYEQLYGDVARRRFNSAGAKTYIDGYNAERSTAEYGSIREAIAGSRGVERFVSQLSRSLLKINPDVQHILHSRHVGFFSADTVGTQDNMYIPALDTSAPSPVAPRVERLITAFCLTRPYMTGAGDYTHGGRLAFAQKMAGLSKNRLLDSLDVPLVMLAGGRAEIRENDINLCDAAAMVRMGGAAICAAIAQTPLHERFEDFMTISLQGGQNDEWSNRYNLPVMLPDGSFDRQGNKHILWAADQHTKIADVFASAAMRRHGGEQPGELLRVAEKMCRIAELMKRLLRQDVSIENLMPLSDWATKEYFARRDVAPELYDITALSRGEDGNPGPVIDQRGFGFMLRDAGHFEDTIPDAEVTHAYYNAPADTRAALRAYILTNYRAAHVGWQTLRVFDANNEPTYIDLPSDPRTDTFSPGQQSILSRAQRR